MQHKSGSAMDQPEPGDLSLRHTNILPLGGQYCSACEKSPWEQRGSTRPSTCVYLTKFSMSQPLSPSRQSVVVFQPGATDARLSVDSIFQHGRFAHMPMKRAVRNGSVALSIYLSRKHTDNGDYPSDIWMCQVKRCLPAMQERWRLSCAYTLYLFAWFLAIYQCCCFQASSFLIIFFLELEVIGSIACITEASFDHDHYNNHVKRLKLQQP